ncbi:hypothetical protein BXT90_09560 [Corynebacterium amycolatum]|uniref:hypothetical protein n=1 Tax=Corynebacterium amycolatum TaxID=43765 RepID=UPI0009763E3F|nr:hypothetical protein [Corynebacterium amycolatum]MDC7116944.1 hypothetical protein [Corynebacterium amycolatum]OMQ04783.1 hypothetical protein BXT90_09560 [Corynebacterium amycolatum]
MTDTYQPKTDPKVLDFLAGFNATGELPPNIKELCGLTVDLPAGNGFRKIIRMGDMTPEDFSAIAREIQAGMYGRCA